MTDESDIPTRWLRHRTTPEEVERARLETMAAGFNIPLDKVVKRFGGRPMGALTAKWRDFVELMGEGDELWFFCSPEAAFVRKLGCAGYAILRHGVIRETLITVQT